MKKLIIMMTLILLTVFLSSGSALAWRGHSRGHGHFGIFIAPPPIWIGPPAIIYRGYYPPPYHYPPNYYEPDRVWVPGHWEERQGPYGWEKVWIPGYWQYNP
jgi:hypothetical protein